jgi:ABC-type nitrate/sulfonate/bicarbonate transport system permease component
VALYEHEFEASMTAIGRRAAAQLAEVGLPLLLIAAIWEITVRLAGLPPKLFPSVAAILTRALALLGDGILWHHAWATLGRLFVGFVIAALLGVGVGLAMGRARRAQDFCLPLLSVLMPIPPLAWVPLFILWFGLGNLSTILLVAFAAAMPIAFNVWTGVRSVKDVWIRAATVMGASEQVLFRRVILPGAMPAVVSGLRIGMARAWPAVVSGEMIAAAESGLGWMIFASREFLNTDVMFVGIAVVGLVGLFLERVVFQQLEVRTVTRWGMLSEAAG